MVRAQFSQHLIVKMLIMDRQFCFSFPDRVASRLWSFILRKIRSTLARQGKRSTPEIGRGWPRAVPLVRGMPAFRAGCRLVSFHGGIVGWLVGAALGPADIAVIFIASFIRPLPGRTHPNL